MSRVRVYSPENKGDYYRSIVNALRRVPPYDPDALIVLAEAIPIDASGMKHFPYGQLHETGLPVEECSGSIYDGINFYKKHHEGIEQAHQMLIRTLLARKPSLHSNRELSSEMRTLFWTAVGLSEGGFKDKRSSKIQARDLWYLGALHDVLEDLQQAFSCCILLSSVQQDERDALYELGSRNLPDGFKVGPVRMVLEGLERSHDEQTLYRLVAESDQLSEVMMNLIALGQLELFRDLAMRTWRIGPDRCELTPIELLYLNHYVGLTRSELGLSQMHDGCNCVSELREENKRFIRTEDWTSSFPRSLRSAIANLFLDFWNELSYYNLCVDYKGSFQCKECQQIIPRKYDAYGQKYCSDQCKRRAAKRRERKKKGLSDRMM